MHFQTLLCWEIIRYSNICFAKIAELRIYQICHVLSTIEIRKYILPTFGYLILAVYAQLLKYLDRPAILFSYFIFNLQPKYTLVHSTSWHTTLCKETYTLKILRHWSSEILFMMERDQTHSLLLVNGPWGEIG